MSSYSDYIRLQFEIQEQERDKGLTMPEDIRIWKDIRYGDDEVQILDIYKPLMNEEDGEKKLPVIVNVHGGGWVYGKKEGYQFYCMELAGKGFTVISFDYHLAPEFKFPTPIRDTALLFEWILEHADEYLLDKDNIFAFSDSAGSNILLSYYGCCLNKDFRNSISVDIKEYPSLKGLVCNCGVYRVMMNDPKDPLTAVLAKEYLEKCENDQDLMCLDITRGITGDFPPVFFCTGTGDFLSHQTGILSEALLKANVPFQFHSYGDAKNRLGHVFNTNIRSQFAKKCNMDEIAFVKSLISED